MDNAEKLATQPRQRKQSKNTPQYIPDAIARKHTQTRHEHLHKQPQSKTNRTSFLWGNRNLVS